MRHPVGVRPPPLLLLTVVAALLAGCSPASSGASVPSPTGPLLRVGTGPDLESRLLATVIVELLAAAEIPAEVVEFADARDARQALELGAVDVRPAYTGEAWLEVLGRADPPADPRTSLARVKDFDERNGIVWMRPGFPRDGTGPERPPANATFAFFVPGPPGVSADLRTMSQLATRLAEQPDAMVCVDEEFADRPDGLVAVWETYRVRLDREVYAVSPEDAPPLVAAGECVAGLSTATAGEAWRLGLHPLVDDLQVFPAFVVVPTYREEAVDSHPGLEPALTPLAANLTTGMLGRWNARLVAGAPLALVATEAAQELLVLAGRVAPPTPDPAAEPAVG